MDSPINNLTADLKRIHDDEDGMEAITVIMIVALAAVILIVLKVTIWPLVKDWVEAKITELKS